MRQWKLMRWEMSGSIPDHLLLGILRESACQAAEQLTAAGLTFEESRSMVMENQSSRPNYGPVFPLGSALSWTDLLMSRWRWWKARRSERKFTAKRRKSR
jgi:hypothetical protein